MARAGCAAFVFSSHCDITPAFAGQHWPRKSLGPGAMTGTIVRVVGSPSDQPQCQFDQHRGHFWVLMIATALGIMNTTREKRLTAQNWKGVDDL